MRDGITGSPAMTPPASDGEHPRELRWEGDLTTRWAHWWGIPAFEAYHSVSSTNDILRARAAEGAAPFTVVVAEAQAQGRGREGKGWHAPPGMGLWFSVLVEPPGGAEALPTLPLRVGLALASAVEASLPGLRPQLKWPNDLMVGGRKVAGVLCEVVALAGGGTGVVVGVGINLRQGLSDFPAEIRGTAGSLYQVTGGDPDRGFLMGAFISHLRDGLRRASGPGLTPQELGDLEERDPLRGRRVRVDPVGEGVARGIDASGALLFETGSGEIRKVMAGSVRPVDP